MDNGIGDEGPYHLLLLAGSEGLEKGKRFWPGCRRAWRGLGVSEPFSHDAEGAGDGTAVLGVAGEQQPGRSQRGIRDAVFHRSVGRPCFPAVGYGHALDRLWTG